MMDQRPEATMEPSEQKVCKQCGRKLPVDSFRKYRPRGKGIYNTKQGRSTLCKNCESVNNIVAGIERREAAGTATVKDAENKQLLIAHYQQLIDLGLPPVTAAAKRLMGLDDTKAATRKSLESTLVDITAPTKRHAEMRQASEAIRARIEAAEAEKPSKVVDTPQQPPLSGNSDWSKELREFVDAYRRGAYNDDIDRADDDFKAVRSELYQKDPELADEIDEFCGF